MAKTNIYLITVCPNCKLTFYFKYPQKTKRCTRCGKLLKTDKLNVLYRANNADDALATVLRLKKPDDVKEEFQVASKILDEQEK